MTNVERYGPWAVVTGASDGIGREMAVRIAGMKLNVALVARREHELRTLAIKLSADHGVQTRVLAVDLAYERGLDELEDATLDLDVGLVVLAAGFGHAGPFVESSLRTELDMVAVNVTAVTRLAHTFANRMTARGVGGIVMFGSLLGWQGVPGQATYAASKAFVQALAEGLNRELAADDVHVLAVAPGPVHSGFAGRAGMAMRSADTPAAVASATLSALGRRRTTVVPGWRGRVLTTGLATLPRRARIAILARVMRSMRLSAEPS